MIRIGLALTSLLVVLLLAAGAVAAQTSAPVRRVELVFEGTWDPAVVEAIESDLASEHALRGVPSGTSGEERLVRIVFTMVEGEIHIAASNTLTGLERARDVSLEGLPTDSYGVVVAAAADELVSATWPDDMRFPDPAPPPPPEPPPPPPPPPPPAAPRLSWSLGALASPDVYQSGPLHLGADVRIAHLPLTWLGFALRIGARRALPEDTPLGRVHTRSASVALEAFVRLLGASRALHLDLLASVRMLGVGFSSDGETATNGNAWGLGVSARGGVRFVFAPLRRLRPMCELTLGGSLRRVVATDETRIVAGPHGVEGGVACGAEWAF